MSDHAPDSVQTLSGHGPGDGPTACTQCRAPLTPRPRGRNGRFCSTRCRTRWHAARRTQLLTELMDALDRATAIARELLKD